MPTGTAHAVDRVEPGPFAWRMWSPGALGPRMALASAVIALLCVCAWRPGGPARGAPGAQQAEAPFVPSVRATSAPHPVPAARFGLAEAGLDPVRVAARIDPRMGLREDVLTRGDFVVSEAPALRVTLTRGGAARTASTLFVLMARRAAGGPVIDGPALSVLRTGTRGSILTKFGAVETLEVTFSGTAQRTCTGFVTQDAAFRLDGWFCAPLGHPPEMRALGCMVDALSLVDPADPETTAIFAAAPLEGRACPSALAAPETSGRTGSVAQRARNKK